MEEKYLISEDHGHLFETTAEIMISRLLEISDQPHIVLGLCGGRSVSGLMEILAPSRSKIWRKVEFFLVDERLVPADHPDSNFRLIRESLFESLLRRDVISETQLHPFVEVPSQPDRGVGAYSKSFQQFGNKFDIVLLSAGEDGHVASLFPNHPSVLTKGNQFVLVENAPKPPPSRISASIGLLGGADYGIGLFLGASKSAALKNFHDDNLGIEACPAKVLEHMSDRLVVTDIELD